jgi:hypothetical protein
MEDNMSNQTTITQDTSPLAAVTFAVMGGAFIIRKVGWSDNIADVLDNDGNVIGGAHRIYSNGWAVHTRPYGGYVPDSQIVEVS